MRVVPALFVLSLCVAALVYACSSNDASAPSTVRLSVEAPLAEEEAPLILESPLVEEIGSVESEELMLEPQSMLDAEVTSNPVPPTFDDSIDDPEPPRRRWLMGDAEETPRAVPAAGGTLFERMSNIARGAAKADVAPTAEPSDPLDIPRFLNRQNNQ